MFRGREDPMRSRRIRADLTRSARLPSALAGGPSPRNQRPPGASLQFPAGAVDAALRGARLEFLPLAAPVLGDHLQVSSRLEDGESAGREVVPVLLAVRVVAGR